MKLDERQLTIAAKCFWLDCYGDENYPFKTWQEQREEMRGAVSQEFIEFVSNGVDEIELQRRIDERAVH